MKMIENWQLRTMYAIGRSLGMEKDDLHALANTQSLKLLSLTEANVAIAELKQRQKQAGVVPAAKSRKREKPTVPGGVTSAQQGKVWALMGELEKWDAEPSKATCFERLCGIIKKEFGMDAAPTAPFRWLDMRQGSRLIDTLKRYATSAERKALREGRVKHG